MANYRVITIGINQYRHFQPLMHAQDDALSIHRFFTQEAGISEDRCILLSDLTTSAASRAVYPDKAAIAQRIQTLTQQVEEGDLVWLFFSGYGVQVEGKDYLMPIDGDADNGNTDRIESTGIAAADLIHTLAQLPTENTALILDINRSQGALSGQTIGTEIIALAQEKQITALLSCQPEQYSHETLGVRHGLFTAALLEAIRQERKTTSQISEYINKRIPELCEHHWRPIQNPVVVAAAAKTHSTIVPDKQSTLATAVAEEAEAPVTEAPVTEVPVTETADDNRHRTSNYQSDSYRADSYTSEQAIGAAVKAGTGATALATSPSDRSSFESASEESRTRVASVGPSTQTPYTEEAIATGSYRTQGNGQRPLKHGDSLFLSEAEEEPLAVTGAKLRNWGLLALTLLMGGVLLKQPFVQTAWQDLTARVGQTNSSDRAEPLSPETTETETTGTDVTEVAPVSESADIAASASEEQVSGSETAAQTSSAPESSSDSASSSSTDQADTATSQPAAATDAAAEKAASQALIAQASAAIEQRQYSEALIALRQVPRSQRDSNFSSVLSRARTGAAEAKQTNRSTLTEARTSIQPTQASQFTEAITKARLIQPGEPFYEEAQRDIRSWSQVILDIAEGRATSGNLEGAIAAANVMPNDDAELHQKAQDRIAFWQQRQSSRKTIAEAQTIPKLGQASTYQQGIVKLGEVPIEHPEYETAQRLADQWSQSIFSIAQARAAQGRQNAAIQAAILVPAGTTAYEPTQQAIRRWKAEE